MKSSLADGRAYVRHAIVASLILFRRTRATVHYLPYASYAMTGNGHRARFRLQEKQTKILLLLQGVRVTSTNSNNKSARPRQSSRKFRNLCRSFLCCLPSTKQIERAADPLCSGANNVDTIASTHRNVLPTFHPSPPVGSRCPLPI